MDSFIIHEDKNGHFWTTYPPHLVHVVIERPLRTVLVLSSSNLPRMCHIIYIPVANLSQVSRTQGFMAEISAKKVKSRQDKAFSLNTQYATDSYFVYVLKMEYGWNFWLKVSFGIVINTIKIFFEIPPCSKKGAFCYWICIFRPKSLFLWSKPTGLKIALRMEGFQKNSLRFMYLR